MNPTALITHEAGGVTVVVMDHCAVCISQITDRIQLGDRAIHGEHAISRNQNSSGARVARFLKLGFKIGHIIVAVTIA